MLECVKQAAIEPGRWMRRKKLRTYLFLGDLDALSEDGPNDGLVARGRGQAAIVTVVAGAIPRQ